MPLKTMLMFCQTNWYKTARENNYDSYEFQEQNLDTAALSRRSDITQVPELADYLKYMKFVEIVHSIYNCDFRPKKLALKGYKRSYFMFRDLYLSWHNNAAEVNGPPLGHISLKG